MSLRRLVLLTVVAAAILAPATAASASSRPPKLRLGLVPLQKAKLGPEAASFDAKTKLPMMLGKRIVRIDSTNPLIKLISPSAAR